MKHLVERFLRYVTFDTQSNPHETACPSSGGQLVFAQQLKKEMIELYGKSYEVLHIKLRSKNENLPKEKKLNFDIWLDPRKGLIVKIAYERMGKWEYRLKNFE